ncbi:glutamine-hydrolyzing GMP synthase [Patescibacteria group bacterium]|nr:glutamine-hydrolyzing GMP synthase [Patescibacteria group bacterium]
MEQKQISILDFGSQYTHLIARRIRQLGVLANIYPPETPLSKLKNSWGIILSGGPNSVYEEKIKFDKKILSSNTPILGVCYGHQLITHLMGGRVEKGNIREYGIAKLSVHKSNGIFHGLRTKEQVWMSHGDLVSKPPKGFKILAKTDDCPVASMGNDIKKIYGVQFHPEVTHTECGSKFIKNFVFDVCGAKKEWNIARFLTEIEDEIKNKVGKRKVFLLVSGGVDSAVCFGLLNRILGKEKVFGLHIDLGFMRKDESKKIKNRFDRLGFTNLEVINASALFKNRLKDVVDPEYKRKIIGKTYLDVQRQAMKKFKLNPKEWILAQGTIYPDTIESGGTKHADTIKTHHNRVKEVMELVKRGLVIEPLKELYKDEVRLLGKKVGLPNEIINRHPFPGPGLAIRMICSNGLKVAKSLKKENAVLDNLISQFNYQNKLDIRGWVLPIKSVGVQGDERTYAHPAAISGELSQKQLEKLGPLIGNQIQNVNRACRIVYSKKNDLSQGKMSKLLLTTANIKLLQEIDDIVQIEMKKVCLDKKIWQFPVILAPYSLAGGFTIILRPVQSEEAMTVKFFPLPNSFIEKTIMRLKRIRKVDLVLFDFTNKPPGTIEWE